MDDPRSDLTTDSELWDWFLKRAYEMNQDLAYILHGFRCAGLRLIKTNAGYVMRPEFNKNSLWDNQREYDQDKRQYLIGYTDKIIECLNRLGGKRMKHEKIEKPKCYRPNDNAYPLCLGAEHPVDFAENDCIHCCIYENMEDEGGYSRYDV